MKITIEQALKLYEWYQANKRCLPWREKPTFYHIWISEIMLQQTRVEAVKEKFQQFTNLCPSVYELSTIEDDQLMKLWEGLGYYNRARNLKKCALVVVENFDGVLPKDKQELMKLPGIGPYTSSAISSIAYNLPCAAIDGNVLRILARLFEDDRDIKDPKVRNEYEQFLESFYKQNQEELLEIDSNINSCLNQAWMELGALVCVPNGEPHCQECPFQKTCLANMHQTTDTIPYRSKLKKRRIVNRTIFILKDQHRVYVQKRPEQGLLAGLYEFYGVDEHLSKQQVIQEVENLGLEPIRIHRLQDSKHIFSHLEWHMIAYEIHVADFDHSILKKGLFLDEKQRENFAIPSAFKAYIDCFKTY